MPGSLVVPAEARSERSGESLFTEELGEQRRPHLRRSRWSGGSQAAVSSEVNGR